MKVARHTTSLVPSTELTSVTELIVLQFSFIWRYCRLWLFSAPRQIGAYYYISAYIITVTRPGLLSACAFNRMLRLERSDDRNTKQNAVIAMAQATLEGFAVQENPTRNS